VTFDLGTESPHEWMAWSTMRVDLRSPVPTLMDEPGMEEAWIQLWELDIGQGAWRQVSMSGEQIEFDREGTQVTLGVSTSPRAVLVHLGAATPQVIALPAFQRVMVLLTRAHAQATSEAPRVLVGGYGGTAEGVLEFLRKGALGLADPALDPGSPMAYQMLFEKFDDPLAATAAAYYLLRKRDWDQLPQPWLDNLANFFPAIPDGVLLRDASLIERGMEAREAPALAASSLKTALARGLPLFAEARALMTDLLYYAEQASGADGLGEAQRALIRGMLAAFAPAGLTFGYFGEAPDRPTPARDARRAARDLTLRRGLRSIIEDVSAIRSFAGLLSAGLPGGVAGGLQLAAKGVGAALAAFGEERPVASGNPTQTLFLRDIYAGKEATASTR
jgi:hypothetical protein